MIEQIIEKFEKELEEQKNTFYNEKEDLVYIQTDMNFIKSKFSSYNKQLLDEIEKEVKELENPYSSLDQEWYEGAEQMRRDITTIINNLKVK